MHLTVLGAQAGVPRHGRPSSGYLVSDAGTTVLLDCGPGVATALSGLGVRLDAVVVSHLHLDHVHDLIVLAKQLVTERAPVPLLLVPDGARELFETWQSLFPVPTFPLLDRPFRRAFDIRGHEPVRVGGLALSTHPVAHAVAAVGVRVEGPDATLAYTGDTGVCDGLLLLARDADLLLAEATLDAPDTGSHGHLCAADAARAASAAGVRALALTHLPDGSHSTVTARRAAAAAHFTGPVHIVRPGQTLPC
ncbi:MBL fold metallo-hydrolase [Pseudonocardia abyssalis]|uniref:MBL fold metallo-hydrolase n=1 Tax=Pseudonocardia abyssalis TaxID=2792008 RepID=A0ABS6UKV8_9PSEU|nr:MBL fold metallo-hydrolase [Pseudonocardia abyssalis]MBW0117106.1 MBL fold metallo-hydrolase [Pseudonocardia abyssalis]MBW0132856.1 MBL fold metallo-hydrolase [Pseudonocardia abyssalis]